MKQENNEHKIHSSYFWKEKKGIRIERKVMVKFFFQKLGSEYIGIPCIVILYNLKIFLCAHSTSNRQ